MLSSIFVFSEIKSASGVQIDVILFYNKNVIVWKLQRAQKVSYCSHGEFCEQFMTVYCQNGKQE